MKTCLLCEQDRLDDDFRLGEVCDLCHAEAILSGDRDKVIKGLSNRMMKDLVKTIECQPCGSTSLYDPMVKRQVWLCLRCAKSGLECCMAHVIHVSLPSGSGVMCRPCRAELTLSGVPVGEALKPLPGKDCT